MADIRGLLGSVYEKWKQQPQMPAIGGLLMGDLQPMKEWLGVGQPWPKDAAEQVKQGSYNLAMDWNNPMAMSGLIGHTVWHGSPHKFDKFDMSKIGTGEGAQAYGHGLYFAESPAVADDYARKLSASRGPNSLTDAFERITINDKPLHKQFNVDVTEPIVDYAKAGDIKGLKIQSQNAVKRWKELSVDESYPFQQYAKDKVSAYEQLIGAIDGGAKIDYPQGQMYKVDIPDEILPRMLDWDKPLSQQSPEVQKAMANVIEKKNPRLSRYFKESAGLDEAGQAEVRKRLGINIFDTVDTGGAAYQAAGQGNVEGLLKSMGIPGIRYLDGNSRGTGGTSNFVLFDDRLPRIIERNGVPTGLNPWKDDPEALRGLLGM